MKRLPIILFCLSLGCLLQAFGPDFGYTYGESYLQRADGVYCLTVNPASLARPHTYNTDMAMFTLNLGLRNNSVSNSLVNDLSGKYLDEDDKKDLLDEIDGSAFFGMESDFTLIALGFHRSGFHVGAHGNLSGKVSEDYLNLILNGNEYGTTYHFTQKENDFRAMAYSDISYSAQIQTLDRYITPLQNYALPMIHVGYSLSYLIPIGGWDVSNYNGTLSTSDDGLEVNQTIEVKEGHSGYGFKGMLSFSSEINDRLSVGLAFDNLFGFLKFNSDTKTRYYTMSSDSLYLSELDEDIFADTSYTVESGDFEMRIPVEMRMGGLYRWDQWNLSADYVQHFEKDTDVSPVPMLAVCAEWNGVRVLPLRLAFCTGNERQPLNFTWGGGLHFQKVQFDYGLRVDGSILPFLGAKGVGFSMAARYLF